MVKGKKARLNLLNRIFYVTGRAEDNAMVQGKGFEKGGSYVKRCEGAEGFCETTGKGYKGRVCQFSDRFCGRAARGGWKMTLGWSL